MRHRVKTKKIGKNASHRKAMLSNMASSLIEHKRIKTTHQKALELKKFIEPMITKAKDATLHNRRQVLKSLKNQDAVKTLFDVIGPSYAERPGGYTRIIKLGSRVNDAAKMSLIEFVDKSNLETENVVEEPISEEVESEDN
ncbi:MAG: 50S ribosomal protein L17 [Candidatus Neomarinimicrobiota bacterium]|nr:50S ribosomal protein L17 [Candidatus Neomarinimicrobiota bacterium]